MSAGVQTLVAGALADTDTDLDGGVMLTEPPANWVQAQAAEASHAWAIVPPTRFKQGIANLPEEPLPFCKTQRAAYFEQTPSAGDLQPPDEGDEPRTRPPSPMLGAFLSQNPRPMQSVGAPRWSRGQGGGRFGTYEQRRRYFFAVVARSVAQRQVAEEHVARVAAAQPQFAE